MQEHNCLNCYDLISNPICERCFLNHIELWLFDRNFDEQYQRQIISRLKRIILPDLPRKDSCIVCKEEKVSICSYCFFFKMAIVLRDAGFSKIDVRDFLEMFNYQSYLEAYPI